MFSPLISSSGYDFSNSFSSDLHMVDEFALSTPNSGLLESVSHDQFSLDSPTQSQRSTPMDDRRDLSSSMSESDVDPSQLVENLCRSMPTESIHTIMTILSNIVDGSSLVASNMIAQLLVVLDPRTVSTLSQIMKKRGCTEILHQIVESSSPHSQCSYVPGPFIDTGFVPIETISLVPTPSAETDGTDYSDLSYRPVFESPSPQPKVKKGRRSSAQNSRRKANHWSAEEDCTLMKAVETYSSAGWKGWKEVSKLLPGRTADSCSQRWHRVLNPNIRKGTWSVEEDQILAGLVQQYGTKNWKKISDCVKGRTDIQCRYRWYRIAKRFNLT
ncbi:hypothetical protein GEMRC1_001905 [Eukaryota sp. GEM-RC1]